jgi:hypothetical protein
MLFDKSDFVETLDLRSELRANGFKPFSGFNPFVVSHFDRLRTGLSNHPTRCRIGALKSH